jgi:hypothetical protein
MSKLWPIKSDTACLLKWGWTSLRLDNATSASCHRCRPHSITLDTFDDFHNTPGQISDREKMLDSQWPGDGTGCEYCRDVEAVGGFSDRQFQLSKLQDPELIPQELLTDPTATRVDPTMLEVYFRNTCNMSCVYCGPEYSSQIETEFKHYGDAREKVGIPNPIKFVKNTNVSEMTSRLWKYLEENDRYKKLRRYHILGGEPFLLQELDQSIDFFRRNPNPNLVFSIITNLNIPPKQIAKYIERFQSLVDSKSIWKLQITGSLDGWGSEQEYVRKGLDLDRWEENFTMFAEKSWTAMSINSVLSALTLKGLPKLMDKVNEWNKLIPHSEKIMLSSNVNKDLTSPLWFGPGYFEDYLEQSAEKLDTKEADALLGIKKQIESQTQNVDMIKRLQDYLTELDTRRNTDWRKTFSWLDKDF